MGTFLLLFLFRVYGLFKCLNQQRAASRLLTSRAHEVDKMAAVLDRSFIEICGFERETLHRFRDVTVNLPGNVPFSAHVFCVQY